MRATKQDEWSAHDLAAQLGNHEEGALAAARRLRSGLLAANTKHPLQPLHKAVAAYKVRLLKYIGGSFCGKSFA